MFSIKVLKFENIEQAIVRNNKTHKGKEVEKAIDSTLHKSKKVRKVSKSIETSLITKTLLDKNNLIENNNISILSNSQETIDKFSITDDTTIKKLKEASSKSGFLRNLLLKDKTLYNRITDVLENTAFALQRGPSIALNVKLFNNNAFSIDDLTFHTTTTKTGVTVIVKLKISALNRELEKAVLTKSNEMRKVIEHTIKGLSFFPLMGTVNKLKKGLPIKISLMSDPTIKITDNSDFKKLSIARQATRVELSAIVQSKMNSIMPSGPIGGPPLSPNMLTNRTKRFLSSVRVYLDARTKLINYYYMPLYNVHNTTNRDPRRTIEKSVRAVVGVNIAKRFGLVNTK